VPIFQRHIRAGVSFVRIRKILVNSKKIDLTNPVRPQSCSAQELQCGLWGEKYPKLFLHITYFKLARCVRLCLNAFHEQKKA